MSLAFPQFGNPDYGGFTTDEELARRFIEPDARGSPLIGAQMYVAPGQNTSGAPPMPSGPLVPAVCPPGRQNLAGRSAFAGRQGAAKMGLTVSDAVRQLFQSRPETALDWFLIFILIIASICFVEYARDLFHTTHSKHGGNFCAECGGTV